MALPETPEGKLSEFLIGDLAVARRHIARLKSGNYNTSPAMVQMIYAEIERSIERCIERINRDLVSPAVELGRRGGQARANSLSPERRSEIATQAAQARWSAK